MAFKWVWDEYWKMETKLYNICSLFLKFNMPMNNLLAICKEFFILTTEVLFESIEYTFDEIILDHVLIGI